MLKVVRMKTVRSEEERRCWVDVFGVLFGPCSSAAEGIITVCILPSGHMLAARGVGPAACACVCVRVRGGGPTYVPSVLLPPQMAVAAPSVGAAYIHTKAP